MNESLVRTICTASQYQKVLCNIMDVLNSSTPRKSEDLKNVHLSYNRDGSIDLLNRVQMSLYDRSINSLFHYKVLPNGDLSEVSLNFENIIDFINGLVVESPYDVEIASEYFELPPKVSVTIQDPFIDKIKKQEDWLLKYHAIRDEFNLLTHRIFYVAEMSNMFRGIVKDRLLNEFYMLPGYLPKRYGYYKSLCQQLYDDGKERSDNIRYMDISSLSKSSQNIYTLCRLIFLDFLNKDRNLFTDVMADENARYVVAVYESYLGWTY